MEMTRTAVGILAGLCVAAGAGGAYLVSRTGAPVEANASESTIAAPLVRVEEPAPAPEAVPVAAPARQRVRAVPPRPAASPSAPVIVERPPVLDSGTPAALSPSPLPIEAAPVDTPAGAALVPVFEPAAPQFEELVVSADSVLGLQMETTVSSETARLEDEVVARVVRDIRVADRVAIPAGSKAYGEVAFVGRGGRLRDRARIGVTFTSVVLDDGTRVPIATDTVYREGDSPSRESTAKIGGGAIGGAIIGGILGGAKGAAIGGSVGAGAGTAAVMAGGRNAATLPSGASVTVRLLEPASVTVERE